MLKISVGGVAQLGNGVWRATVEKQDMAMLGDSKAPKGDVAVVMLGRADYDKKSRSLSFALKQVQILTRGKGSDVLFVQSKLYTIDKNTNAEIEAIPPGQKRKPGRPAGSSIKKQTAALKVAPAKKRGRKSNSRLPDVIGDMPYLLHLAAVGGEIEQAGKKLLSSVRAVYAAPLKQQPTDKYRFSQTKDNFWSVRVQKRDKSLLVTLRGTVDKIGPTSLKLEKDRAGFSRVKITSTKEADELAKLLVKAADKTADIKKSA
jgi:hypothetical protein